MAAGIGVLVLAVPLGAATATAPATPVRGGPDTRVLGLEVAAVAGLGHQAWPLSTGVPLPRGVVPDPSVLALRGPRGALPLQVRPLSRWSDGSLRWALVDWQDELSGTSVRRYELERGRRVDTPGALRVTDQADQVVVDTGVLRFTVPKHRFAVLEQVRLKDRLVVSGPVRSFFRVGGVRLDGLPPRSVAVTDSGPVRVRIEVRGRYAARVEYVIRIDAFAGQPFVRLLLSFEQHAAEPYTAVEQIGLEVPMQLGDGTAYTAGVVDGGSLSAPVGPEGRALVQLDNQEFTATGVRRAGKLAGWADLHDTAHGVAVVSRFFWQEYPQSLHLGRAGLTANLWAPEAGPAKVGMGAAKTHELVLYFHRAEAPSPERLAALAQSVPVRLDPAAVVASGAMRNSVTPVADAAAFLRNLSAGYERYLHHVANETWDDSGSVRCSSEGGGRTRRGFYGMLNWGDWNFPGLRDATKGCEAWGNLEYDLPQVLALAYAATGERVYHDGMVAAARHFMDVDRIQFHPTRPGWVGMNHPKNPLHFSFELGGVDLGHTWVEGLLSYYALTGDERGLEAARGIADALVRRIDGIVWSGNPRQWGWPQIALVAAYEATRNDVYRRAAQAYARRGMAAHPPDQITHWKIGILAEGLAYTYSVTDDPAIRDWLVRYAAAVKSRGADVERRLVPAVAYVGRITGQREYTDVGRAVLTTLQFGTWGKPFTIAGRVGFSLLANATPAPAAAVPTAPGVDHSTPGTLRNTQGPSQ